MGSSLCSFSCIMSKYSSKDVSVSPLPPLRTISSDVPLRTDQSLYILRRLAFVHFIGSVQSDAPFLKCTINGFLYLQEKLNGCERYSSTVKKGENRRKMGSKVSPLRWTLLQHACTKLTWSSLKKQRDNAQTNLALNNRPSDPLTLSFIEIRSNSLVLHLYRW